MTEEKELKRFHITLNKADFEIFQKICKENFSSVSAEIKRLIKRSIKNDTK